MCQEPPEPCVLNTGRRSLRQTNKADMRLKFLTAIIAVFFSSLPGNADASFLWQRKSLRDWYERTQTVLGILCLSYAALDLFGIAHDDFRGSAYGYAFFGARGIVIGMVIAVAIVFVTLPSTKSRQKTEQQ